jgi:anti-anti-sigma regulatory factor
MSPQFWIDVAAFSISAVVATSLALTVLGAGPRRALNRFFALFVMMQAISAAGDVLLRLSLWLKIGHPSLLTELASFAFVLIGPVLLMFTTRYVNRRTRRADLAAILGLLMIGVIAIPLFRHQLIFNVHLDNNGLAVSEVSAQGAVLALVPALYMVWSLVLFWQERRQTGEPYLALSVLILFLGFVVGGVLQVPFMGSTATISVVILGYGVVSRQLFNPLRELTEELERKVQARTQELEMAYAEVEKRVEERTAELQRAIAEHERLQQEVIQVQKRAIQELSSPVIPLMNTPQGGIVVMPLVGSVDSVRTRDITRKLLVGIQEHQAEVVILDITGVPVVDSGVADHLSKTIQAVRLKGARAIVTGISDDVAETIVDLGIDWSGIETVADLQTGLRTALAMLGWGIE